MSREIIENLSNGLKSPKSTVGGILTSVAILALSAKEELAEAGFEVTLWVGVAGAVGAFIWGVISPDANKVEAKKE